MNEKLQDHLFWMQLALAEAKEAAKTGEVPVGAIIIEKNEILARAGNAPIYLKDPTGHAEIRAIRIACQNKQNYRLPGTTLYVTLEPCTMCMGAILHARIEHLVYGAADPKTGAAHSLFQLGNDCRLNHQLKVHRGVLEKECGEILRFFFKKRR